ncbi:MAG: 3-phosphoshikimate 1-carboxyvinyltransferase [Desulfobulbaceae bacterium]|nr:3-phosphoshikimate 1-carboxyvinyltransferase [Candidatus Kapabacteria bacterium]MBS3999099.1 3-phosphoshikimate 1-carboxyvinyltransferase [Desulfobulbaceae bacterium]
MKFVTRSNIEGVVSAPPSKSHSQRLLLNSMMTESEVKIKNLSDSDDSIVLINALRHWGKSIEFDSGTAIISGELNKTENVIYLGESGFCARVLPLVALCFEGKTVFIGAKSLFKRPLSDLESIAKQLNSSIDIDYERCRITSKGAAKGIEISIDGSISSQYLTGILYLFSKLHIYQTVRVKTLKSKGYIDYTLESLKSIGVNFSNEDYSKFRLLNISHNHTHEFVVEGDWSAAAFIMGLGAIASGTIKINGLNINSIQPDRAIMDLLISIGAKMRLVDGSIIIEKSELKSFDYNATNTPDLVPVLIPIALTVSGKSTIRGVERLQFKESNRLANLVNQFKRMHAEIEIVDKAIVINGGRFIGGNAQTYNDHRLAMSFAIAGAISERGVIIDDSHCVSKSYPKFWDDMKKLNLEVK